MKSNKEKQALRRLSDTVLCFVYLLDETMVKLCKDDRLGERAAHLLNVLELENDRVRRFVLDLPIDKAGKDKVFAKLKKKAGK